MENKRTFIPVPLSNVLDELIVKLEKQGSTPQFPTGIKKIDEKSWGLPSPGIVVVGARTSEGKSAFSLYLAAHLSGMGVPVCYFSHEDSRTHLMQRQICMMTNIKYFDFRSKPKETIEKINIEKKKEYFNAIDLLFVDEFGITFDELEFAINNLEPMPKIIVIDYIQMIKSEKHRNRKETIEDFMRSAKAIANSKEIIFILVSQINRSAENKRPQLWQLKESGAIEEASDLVLLLHYPFKYDLMEGKESDFSQNLIECSIAKNKNGPVGYCDLFFDPDTFRFQEWRMSEHGDARKPE